MVTMDLVYGSILMIALTKVMVPVFNIKFVKHTNFLMIKSVKKFLKTAQQMVSIVSQ